MKQIGERSELAFAAKAIEHELIPSFPFIPVAYDVIVDNGMQRYRVQVKSTTNFDEAKHGKRWAVTCKVSDGRGGARPYNSYDCDFLAIHVVEINVWYIIPTNQESRMRLTFYPHKDDCWYHRYKESWGLLK